MLSYFISIGLRGSQRNHHIGVETALIREKEQSVTESYFTGKVQNLGHPKATVKEGFEVVKRRPVRKQSPHIG